MDQMRERAEETAAEHLARLGTDAAKWADDFTARFDGKTIGSDGVDWGLMVSWFANAIEVGRTAGQDWRAAVEPDIRADERAKYEPTLLEANATIVRAMGALGPDHPVWLILDDYDGSMDNVEAVRADERRRVREELLAAAAEYNGEGDEWDTIRANAIRMAVNRIAPEGGDRG